MESSSFKSAYEFIKKNNNLLKIRYNGKILCFLKIKDNQIFIKYPYELSIDRKLGKYDHCSLSYNLLAHSKIIEFMSSLRHSIHSKNKTDPRAPYNRKQDYINKKIKKWAKTKTSKSIARRLSSILNEMIKENIPEQIIKIHKNAFSMLGPTKYNSIQPIDLSKEDKYHLNDAEKFKICAPLIIDSRFRNRLPTNLIDFFLPQNFQGKLIKNKNILKTIQNYKSNKIPFEYIANLGFSKLLTKETNDWMEILCHSRINPKFKIALNKLNKKDIIKAIKIINPNCNLRKFTEVYSAIGHIGDYRGDCNGNIITLAKKTKEFHERLYTQPVKINNQENKKNALPPIELPKIEGLKFLEDSDSLAEESKKMNHCVYHSYRELAFRGICYLFHFEYENEHCTIEVSQGGDIVQSKGPKNIQNNATKQSYKVLKKWCNNLKDYAINLSLKNNILKNNEIPF